MRPLLILDCDGVILEFAEPFRRWLARERQVELRFDSFALSGNMRHMDDGRMVAGSDFPGLLDGFFAGGQGLQVPAPGVVDALMALADEVDLVVLTNITEAHRAMRIEVLRSFGLDLQVVVNQGPKGPVVAELAAGRPAVFVDDLPPHLSSAAQDAPDVGRLHMVADATLRGLIPAAPAAHARIDEWPSAARWIRGWFALEARKGG